MGNARASKHANPFTIQFLKFRSPVDIFSSSITIAFSFIVFRERERERLANLYIYVHRTVSRELSKRGFCAIAFRFFRRMSIVPRKSSSGSVVAVFTETYGTVFFPPLPSKATFGFTETAINTVLSPRIARRKFRSRLSTFKKHNALFCFPSAFKTSSSVDLETFLVIPNFFVSTFHSSRNNHWKDSPRFRYIYI